MARMDWFRSWHGAPTDPKWLLISQRTGVAPAIVFAIFWALCDHASRASDRGSIHDFDAETYAAFGGLELEQVEMVIQAFRDKRLIVGDRLAAWERRQPQREDDSADRVRAHRERQRTTTPAATTDVTPCNADVTPVTRGNAPEKRERREELTSPHGDAPPGEPIELNGPYAAVAAMCEVLGTDPHVLDNKALAKQCRKAKELLDRGVSLGEIRDYTTFLVSQDWRDEPPDMFTVARGIDKWRLNGRPPAPRNRGSPRQQTAEVYTGLNIAAYLREIDEEATREPD